MRIPSEIVGAEVRQDPRVLMFGLVWLIVVCCIWDECCVSLLCCVVLWRESERARVCVKKLNGHYIKSSFCKNQGLSDPNPK